jgi:biotin carboxyl carrier protein
MTLTVMVDGRPLELRLERSGEACRFQTDGKRRDASVVAAEPGIYSVLLDGESFEAKIVPGPRGWFVDVRGRRFEIEVRDPRRYDRRSRGLAGEGRQQVTAPMPGKVVRTLVAAGDRVEAGQGLVVVEAMKMQNEIRSPRKGVVKKILAAAGTAVNAGETLAVVE